MYSFVSEYLTHDVRLSKSEKLKGNLNPKYKKWEPMKLDYLTDVESS